MEKLSEEEENILKEVSETFANLEELTKSEMTLTEKEKLFIVKEIKKNRYLTASDIISTIRDRRDAMTPEERYEDSIWRFLKRIEKGEKIKSRYELRNDPVWKKGRDELLDITDFFNRDEEHKKLFGILMELNDFIIRIETLKNNKEFGGLNVTQQLFGKIIKNFSKNYGQYFSKLLNKIGDAINYQTIMDNDLNSLRLMFRKILDANLDSTDLPTVVLKSDNDCEYDYKQFEESFKQQYNNCRDKNHITMCMKSSNHLFCYDIRIINNNLKITFMNDRIERSFLDLDKQQLNLCKVIEKVIRARGYKINNVGCLVSLPPFDPQMNTYFFENYADRCYISAAIQSAIMEKIPNDMYEKLAKDKMFMNSKGERFKFEDVNSKETTVNHINRDNSKKKDKIAQNKIDDDKQKIKINKVKISKNKNNALNSQLKQSNNFVLPNIFENKCDKMKNNNKRTKISKKDYINKINGTMKSGLLAKHIKADDIAQISKKLQKDFLDSTDGRSKGLY